MAVSATRASVTSSASRYVFGRPATPRGMIVETRANDATGSSGLRANDAFRPPSSLTRSVPQTWQKCATSGREVLQREHSTSSLSDRHLAGPHGPCTEWRIGGSHGSRESLLKKVF